MPTAFASLLSLSNYLYVLSRSAMTSSFGEDGPAIVQLKKWEPSSLPLNLAHFREAFLSPKWDLIFLISYHNEGLLLPLVKGVRVDDQINSDPVDMGSCNTLSFPTDIARSNSYTMLSDINSLAWGICEDSNNEYEGASFRELLFVVGDHGLTVHAFCQPSQCYESIEAMPDGQNGEGIWMEWGPSTSRDAMHLNKPDDNVEKAEIFLGSGGYLLENAEPRKWVRTFLTKVETVESEGEIYSRFPDKSQFPSSSKVVSFNIFENDSRILRFILNKNTDLDREGDEMKISYKCCRVFVNSSHDLIGFVLTWVSVNANDESERKLGKTVLVGKIVSWSAQ